MERSNFFVAAFFAITLGTTAPAEPISVKHIQRPMHRLMAARSETGKNIASGEFSQVVQGEAVTMRLTGTLLDRLTHHVYILE
jgi:hypothetical protein